MTPMKSLIATNPYLRDPIVRDRMLRHSVRESSAFEGARPPRVHPAPSAKGRRKASAKTNAKGS
mgnify:CR=1 FL=1